MSARNCTKKLFSLEGFLSPNNQLLHLYYKNSGEIALDTAKRMNRVLILALFVFFCSSKNIEKDCSELKYSLDLNFTIPQVRPIEKELNSVEVFTDVTYGFGYRKFPLKENEKNQPKFFIQKLDDYLVETTYYYDLPDSNVYALIYEWENVHGALRGTYIGDTFSIDKMPTEEYLKCQFQELTTQIKSKFGNYNESVNFGVVREWNSKNINVHLNLTLGKKTDRRLRLVAYKK